VNWQRINSGGLIASTLYSDLTASNGSTYYYAATAVNISGAESAKSTPFQVAVP
jgi:fibronectin type 3 domain-containing protein